MKRRLVRLSILSLMLLSILFTSCVTAPTVVPTPPAVPPSNTVLPPPTSPMPATLSPTLPTPEITTTLSPTLPAPEITTTPTFSPTPAFTEPPSVTPTTLTPGTGGLKLLNDSDVTDIAQSSDGSLIYVVDAQTATGNVYKSTDGGYSFTVLTSPASVALTHVTVAPDRADVIAVTDGVSVYISITGGYSWAILPALPAPWAGASISDVAIGPARSGTLFGREYVVAISDPLPATTARGDILIIGNIAVWASVGAAAGGNQITGSRDYVAVTVTPNFAGDRSVVSVGVGVAGGSTAVEVINTATNIVVSRALLNPNGTTADFGMPATGIVKGSLSLPRDFEASTSSARTGYAGIASASPQADNDVYRFDDTTTSKLGAVRNLGICSVSYSGTITAGTLFEGRIDDAEIRYTRNPTAAVPTWINTKKLLVPFTNHNTVVLAARDFVTSNKVFAGTSGPQSGFSVSTNGGVSFDQTALID